MYINQPPANFHLRKLRRGCPLCRQVLSSALLLDLHNLGHGVPNIDKLLE